MFNSNPELPGETEMEGMFEHVLEPQEEAGKADQQIRKCCRASSLFLGSQDPRKRVSRSILGQPQLPTPLGSKCSPSLSSPGKLLKALPPSSALRCVLPCTLSIYYLISEIMPVIDSTGRGLSLSSHPYLPKLDPKA